MIKQTFSITKRNKDWLEAQVESGQYGSASEVIRDMIREREHRQDETREEIEWLRAKLSASLQSGVIDETPDQMLSTFKQRINSSADV